MSETVKINVSNRERMGEDVIVCFNGTIYQMKDGAVVDVPRGVYEILKQAVYIRYDMKDIPMGQAPRRNEVPRFNAVIVGDSAVVEKDDLTSKVMNKLKGE